MLFSASPPQLPRENHHTPPLLLLNGYPAVNPRLTHNTKVSHGSPLLVRQAVQEFIDVSMSSIQPQAYPPQADIVNVFPNRKRRVYGWPCPVSGCPSSLGRTQEQKRHLLVHLPRWIHCPAPDCSWRGDRLSAFLRHWGNGHPSGSQVPHEDQYKLYDPLPLMKDIAEGTLCIRAAQTYAISMVQKKASELGKPELCENLWGRKPRKPRKVQ